MRENDGSAFALVDIGHSPAIDFQELLSSERLCAIGHTAPFICMSCVRLFLFLPLCVKLRDRRADGESPGKHKKILEFLRHDVPVLCLFRRHARVEHLARLLGDVVKDLAHRGDTALPAKLPMSRHAGYHPLASKSSVYTTFCSGTRTTMSVPECPGYDSISAVSPPSSTFIGSFAGSSGRFGTASTLAFASWNTIVNAFKSLFACARSTSDLASFMRISNGPSAAARSAPWSGV